jgi:hypothetical protein
VFEYVSIGPSPTNEQCAQLGEDDYHERSVKECRAYIRQLRRVLGEEPEGSSLSVKSHLHDFGSYREVVCYHDDREAAVDYAYRAEEKAPAEWDEIARQELGLVAVAAIAQ